MQMWRRIIFGMEAVTVRGLEKGFHLGVRGEFGGSWWEWVVGVGIGIVMGGSLVGSGESWKEV